jgi:hypothetical protein
VSDFNLTFTSSLLQYESMRIGSKPFGAMFLGLCASIGCAGLLQAQTGEVNVTWQGTVSVATTSSVTSAEYKWLLKGYECESIVSTGPLIRNGSNFWYNFDLERETGPVPCPQYIAQMTTPAVLGTLAPGNYALITTSWGMPVATNTFTIPSTPTPLTPPGPVLCPAGFCTNGSFQIQMSNCDSNKSYVLQCSTNLMNWTSLSTNSGGPPLMDPSPVLPGPCYYRVQILQQ